MDATATEFIAEMNSYSEMFDKLCATRHADGQEEYGPFTFLENDVVRMMAEELADTSNYCRMQFIKIMILQKELIKEISDKLGPEAVELGIGSFKGVKKGWE